MPNISVWIVFAIQDNNPYQNKITFKKMLTAVSYVSYSKKSD